MFSIVIENKKIKVLNLINFQVDLLLFLRFYSKQILNLTRFSYETKKKLIIRLLANTKFPNVLGELFSVNMVEQQVQYESEQKVRQIDTTGQV